MKISEAFDKYMREEVVAMNYSKNTFEAYYYAKKTALEFFGNKSIKRIDLSGVHDYYIWLANKVSKNSARHYVSDLRVIIKFCRKHGVNVMNPDEIRIPRAEKKVARFLSEDEYNRFISIAARPVRGYPKKNLARNVLIIKMLYETGLRVSELCALNRGSIHNRQFTVVGKSKEPRPCFITEELEEMIADYLAMRDDDNDALFIADQNGLRVTPHNIQRIFRNISRKANMGVVTPHTLRHSYATRFLERGVDIRIVSALLGHQNLSTTQTYTHVTDYLLRQAYEITMEGKNSRNFMEKPVANHLSISYN